MTAKRALNFGTPSTSKRRRTMGATTVVLRTGPKPEMKHTSYTLAHSAVANANLSLSTLAQGSDVNNRIGNKVKIWRITGQINSDEPIKAHLLMPYDASATPATGFSSTNVTDQMNYKIWCLNPSDVTNGPNVYDINYKFPSGIVVRYGSSTSTDVIKNHLYFQTNTPSATTVSGYIRIWYTDV